MIEFVLVFMMGIRVIDQTQTFQDLDRCLYFAERLHRQPPIPSAVLTYCAAIRKDCSDICTAIDDAKDITAFKVLYTNELNSDKTIKTVARVNRWSDDTNVQQYVR
jgi:hypothetical protein